MSEEKYLAIWQTINADGSKEATFYLSKGFVEVASDDNNRFLDNSRKQSIECCGETRIFSVGDSWKDIKEWIQYVIRKKKLERI
jgi:hypothetical protein